MDINKNVFVLVVITLLLSSCTIQKRRYTNGYSIERKTQLFQKNSIERVSNEVLENMTLKDVTPISPLNLTNLNTTSIKVNECDTIYLKTGDKLIVRVDNIESRYIDYKLCGVESDGSAGTIKRKDIESIQFANGTTKNYSINAKSNGLNDRLISGTDYLDTIMKKETSTFTSLEEKLGAIPRTEENEKNKHNKNISGALYLMLFSGLLGLHRFYLGYYFIGALYLFTAGFCGIGVLVDIILFFTGKLRPKKGSYLTTN